MTDYEALKKRLTEFKHNPNLFVEKVFGVTPTTQQAALLNEVAKPGAHITVRSGHGTGKSTSLAWAVLWFIPLFEDCKVPCTAPTSHQLHDVLWPEISKWHNKMHPFFKEQIHIGKEIVYLKGAEKTQFAVPRTSRKENPDALQGFHATNLLFLLDEAPGIPEPIYEVAEGALSTKSARVVMTGNPTKLTGYFYNSHHRDRELWTKLHFNCIDSPLVDQAYIDRMGQKYGDEHDIYKVRVLGDFPSAAISQLIPIDLVSEAAGKSLHPDVYKHAPVILGVDVARFGDDASTVYKRQGLAASKLGKYRQIDTMRLADVVAQKEDEEKADAVFIDVGAMGAGVVDRLRQMGRRPIEINFGGKAEDDNRFQNKRAEMWFLLKEWLQGGGAIPNDQELCDDLIAPEYFFTPNGKLALEKKSDMKERGLPSPDDGDGLALTFGGRVASKHKSRFTRKRKSKSDYDVLNYNN